MKLTKPLPVHHINETSWVMIRLLYVLSAIDPSLMNVPEIQRIVSYINRKYRHVEGFNIALAFDLLKKKHGKLDTFNNVEVHSFRNLSTKIHYDYEDEEEREFMQRKVFGLSRQEPKQGSSSDVIQKMLDRINSKLGGKK